MKFGVNTFIWSDQFDESVESLLPTLRERGFDGVEVPLFRPAEFPGMNIRKASTGSDLECTVCSVLRCQNGESHRHQCEWLGAQRHQHRIPESARNQRE